MQSKNELVQDPQASPAEPLKLGRLAGRLLHNMPLGIVAFDRDLNITDHNPAAQKLLAPKRNIAEALEVGIAKPRDRSWSAELQDALSQSEARTFENVVYALDASSYVLRIICTPVMDASAGTLLGGILLIEDVTSKAAMENDLADAERLAAVGRLAAGVAHELNNPLDGILRYINLTLRVIEQAGMSQPQQYLEQSRKGLLRMVQIISELLEFSRSTYSAVEEADINKIVEDAIKAMESQAESAGVPIRREYGDSMPNIRSGNLYQVFCNLIKNAVDATNDGGELAVKTSCDDRAAVIEFADNGEGMEREVLDKLFEPFFTTKEPGRGTGLGLAICKDIVERYGGQITAENRAEGGSVFRVVLPIGQMSSRGGEGQIGTGA